MQYLCLRFIQLCLIIFVTALVSNNSIAQDKATCAVMAAEMNKSLPAKIDFLTTLQSTSCVQDLSTGQVHFEYIHTISNPSVLPNDVQKKAKASAKSQYCSNKGFRNALRYYVFDFNYFDTSRQLLYAFSLKNSDC